MPLSGFFRKWSSDRAVAAARPDAEADISTREGSQDVPETRPFILEDYRPVTLPAIYGMEPGIVAGRSPYDGYARGWGLQFGDLADAVARDALYQDATSLIDGRPSHQSETKRMNMFLIMTHFLGRLDSRNIIEFGVYKGGSAIFCAAVAKHLFPEAKVYALDTFDGMPTTNKSIDAHGRGDFDDAQMEEVRAVADKAGLDNLVLIKGLFQDTFPSLAERNVRFGLAHIDCDIYDSVRYSQDAVWPQMAPGGYVTYDDADVSSCLGATQAVEELIMDRRLHCEQIWPHFVFRADLAGPRPG